MIETSTDPLRPVFVLGLPRSGTSIVRHALVAGAGWKGHSEGHAGVLFAAMAGALATEEARHEGEHRERRLAGTMLGALPAGSLRQELIAWTRRTYEATHEHGKICDKTPGLEGLRASPWMAEAFPRARFLYCLRHPVDTLASHLAKFEDADQQAVVGLWLACQEALLRVQEQLGSRLVVVRNEILDESPESVVEKVRAALGFDEEETAGFASVLGSDRLQSTRLMTPGRCLALNDLPVDPETRARFADAVGPTAERLGYSLAGRLPSTIQPIRFGQPTGRGLSPVHNLALEDFAVTGRGRISLRLQPDAGRQSLRYERVLLDGQGTLCGGLSLGAPAGARVRLHLSLQPAASDARSEASRESLGTLTLELEAGERRELQTELLPAPHGAHCFRLTIEHSAVSQATGPLSLHWQDLRLAAP